MHSNLMKTNKTAATIAAELILQNKVTPEGVRAAVAAHRWVEPWEVIRSLDVQMRGDDSRRAALGI